MTRFLLEIHKIDDSSKRIMTEGLLKYAQGFYILAKKSSMNNSNYKKIIKKITDYFLFMDEKYYSELENKNDDMKELVELLDKKEI